MSDFQIVSSKIMLDPSYKRTAKARVYVFPKGESIMDNLLNRRSRPIKEFREVAIAALDNHLVDTSKLKLRWSQKAGCGCGCSPGFIVEGYSEKLHRSDVYVDIEMKG